MRRPRGNPKKILRREFGRFLEFLVRLCVLHPWKILWYILFTFPTVLLSAVSSKLHIIALPSSTLYIIAQSSCQLKGKPCHLAAAALSLPPSFGLYFQLYRIPFSLRVWVISKVSQLSREYYNLIPLREIISSLKSSA